MITVEQLAEELGINHEDVVEFVMVFLDYTENEDLPALLEGINSGDCEIVRKRAHSIKGAALNLLLPEISSLAERIEKMAASGNLADIKGIYLDILNNMQIVRQMLT